MVALTCKIPRWRELVRLPEGELARCDIAAVNFACAEGLPGADEIDAGYCLYKLDDWADCVKEYTTRLFPQFRRKPRRYENSEAYFRTICLITVLQRDMGVKYNRHSILMAVSIRPSHSSIPRMATEFDKR